jgi:hypothetical protein
LPSYSIPKALIRERVALEIVSSEPAGWKIPVRRAGSPDSTPNETTSSISKSIPSPILTLWRSPSSRTSIGARSTPRFSEMSGPSAAIGPPSCPLNTAPSCCACVSSAAASMNTPSRQFPSVMTFGVSAIAATLSPPTSVPSTSPRMTLKTSVTRQRS